jgi:hypothetical protein
MAPLSYTLHAKSSKAPATKTKISKGDYIKPKSFGTAKETNKSSL